MHGRNLRGLSPLTDEFGTDTPTELSGGIRHKYDCDVHRRLLLLGRNSSVDSAAVRAYHDFEKLIGLPLDVQALIQNIGRTKSCDFDVCVPRQPRDIYSIIAGPCLQKRERAIWLHR